MMMSRPGWGQVRRSTTSIGARMPRLGAMAALLACALLGTANAYAGTSDSAACRTVRLSDVGWTDVTATTAVFSVLLRDLGYQPQVTVLSVPVTFASMKN